MTHFENEQVMHGDRLPLISCLLVTKDHRRLAYLKRSIACFCQQTYANKELVIVCDGSTAYRRAIAAHLRRLGRDDIRLLFLDGNESLGRVRNVSVSAARGEYVCQWDDDDLNHPDRLTIQFEQLARDGAGASFFADQLQFFYDTRELLWLNWSPDLIPGTLMCAKRHLQRFPYPDLALAEDAWIRERFREHMVVSELKGYGYLYVYTYNGLNAYDRGHHASIRQWHDPGFVSGRERLLERALPVYGLDMASVRVVRQPE